MLGRGSVEKPYLDLEGELETDGLGNARHIDGDILHPRQIAGAWFPSKWTTHATSLCYGFCENFPSEVFQPFHIEELTRAAPPIPSVITVRSDIPDRDGMQVTKCRA